MKEGRKKGRKKGRNSKEVKAYTCKQVSNNVSMHVRDIQLRKGGRNKGRKEGRKFE